MSRPRSIPDDQILDAARRAFTTRGAAATTAEIAHAAGVSEGTLFKRFGSKDRLLVASLGLPSEPPWVALCRDLAGTGDVIANVRAITDAMIDAFCDLVPKLFVMFSCHLHPRDFMCEHAVPPPIVGLFAARDFLATEMASGRLPARDAEIVARVWTAAAKDFAFHEVAGLASHLAADRSAFVDGLVAMVTGQLVPNAGEAVA